MKIAQVALLTVGAAPPDGRGPDRLIAYLAEALAQQGHEVTLVAGDGVGASAPHLAPRREPLARDVLTPCHGRYEPALAATG
jgi:Mrp family chromosome partitioning ATPase